MNSFAIQGHKEKEIHLSNCDIKSLPAVDIKSEMKRSLKDCLFISFHQWYCNLEQKQLDVLPPKANVMFQTKYRPRLRKLNLTTHSASVSVWKDTLYKNEEKSNLVLESLTSRLTSKFLECTFYRMFWWFHLLDLFALEMNILYLRHFKKLKSPVFCWLNAIVLPFNFLSAAILHHKISHGCDW